MVRGEDPDCAGHVHTCTFGSCQGGADVPDPIRNLTPNILPLGRPQNILNPSSLHTYTL